MTVQIEKWKQAKKEKGLSYDDLARLTGLAKSTITNIFCGYIDMPRYETVSIIEKALGLSSDVTEISPNSIVIDDEEERDLIMCFRSVTREAKDALISNAHTAVMFYRSDKK